MIIIRVVRFRTLKFQPRIVTSFRPHGKWGDLLVCLIPSLWCANILINSGFLLKLIEWQNESSLFTVRIRGRQWYWVYKYDLKDVTDILSASKNIGHNKWFNSTHGAYDTVDDYLNLIQLRAANVWLKKYWGSSLKLQAKENFDNFIAALDTNGLWTNNSEDLTEWPEDNSLINNDIRIFSNFDESSRWIKRSFGAAAPVKIIKATNCQEYLFKCRFAPTGSTAVHKNITYNPFLVIKQKRYTLKKKILERNFFVKESSSNFAKSNFFLENGVSTNTMDNLSKTYKFFKKNKKRDEFFNITTSRRLLRTKHTLVLPAHVNITAITNSYDVVHSWFIPGLGLKMDCIPGRATHHTFYADNVGFYYGQCAEICGRYHHHMPIRVCVLPYDQFLLWWHHFGLPKLIYAGKNKQLNNNLFFRKYVW